LNVALPPECLTWQDTQGQEHRALWHSESGVALPTRFQLVDDTLTADSALRLASAGVSLIWQGDFHNAKMLLQAMGRRMATRAEKSKKPVKKKAPAATATSSDNAEAFSPASAPVFPHAFHLYRQATAQRAQILGRLLVPLTSDWEIPLRRAPDIKAAVQQAWGSPSQSKTAAGASESTDHLVSLRELQGLIGAYEWRRQGVEIPALNPGPNNRIYPHYGVFSPIRGEYIDLVADAPLPVLPTLPEGARSLRAFDIGVGTGVLSAVLARRGVQHIIATDLDPRALACAADNLQRLRCSGAVTLLAANLFPDVEAMASDSPFRALPAFASLHPAAPLQADLIVCNPPWLPGKPSSPIEGAIYDFNSQMLKGFLAQAKAHLSPHGEAWLILSDLAEHLGLRSREALLGWIAAGGLQVLGRMDTRAKHPKAMDPTDPLYAARSAELTSLWRLGHLV